jgi:hemerythrin-like domain-containing protein/uncharacterized protein (DUF2249 family)
MTSAHTSGPSLADEHAVLRQEVSVRRRRVLDALGEGRWPDDQIASLVDCLRYELLDQAVNEERQLFPRTSTGLCDARVRHLVDDHVRLRDLTAALADAADAPQGSRDPAAVIALLDALDLTLDRHVRDEEQTLSEMAEAQVPGLGSHEWFPLTEGPIVDRDSLPRGASADAVIERLTRMRPGERVEVRSHSPLADLEDAFVRRGMTSEYGWTYDEEGPHRWRAGVVRRRPEAVDHAEPGGR